MSYLRKLLTILCATALIGGCAHFADDCSTDAYGLGQRDGRLGAYSQADHHAQRCTAPFDRARYDAGWRAGFSERPVPLW